jgi:hypothetical protein
VRDVATDLAPEAAASDTPRAVPAWLRRLGWPVLLAVAVVTAVLAAIVVASPSAWHLLGAGRGLVPEDYYPASGFAVVLGTTLGQATGWAAGSAFLYYLLTRLRFPSCGHTLRLAMTVVYLGLAGLPSFVYHVLYGQWLLGLPRTGLTEWLRATRPDAYWLVVTAHPVVDFALIPLGLVFLGVLWRRDPDEVPRPGQLVVAALALLGTSLALALSLAIHSILVHIRL